MELRVKVTHRRSQDFHLCLEGPDHKPLIDRITEDGFFIMISDDRCDKGIKIKVQDVALPPAELQAASVWN